MKELDLNYVNRYAPYKVWTDNGRDYFVETDHDLLFKIGFVDDQSIWSEGAYQFTINNESNRPSPNDPKLKETFYRMIEAFFTVNPSILLYICETGDDKQALRARLFVRWFSTYKLRDLYVMKTAEVPEIIDEATGAKVMNFAALIVQRSNPNLEEIVNDFDETIKLLKQKPK